MGIQRSDIYLLGGHTLWHYLGFRYHDGCLCLQPYRGRSRATARYPCATQYRLSIPLSRTRDNPYIRRLSVPYPNAWRMRRTNRPTCQTSSHYYYQRSRYYTLPRQTLSVAWWQTVSKWRYAHWFSIYRQWRYTLRQSNQCLFQCVGYTIWYAGGQEERTAYSFAWCRGVSLRRLSLPRIRWQWLSRLALYAYLPRPNHHTQGSGEDFLRGYWIYPQWGSVHFLCNARRYRLYRKWRYTDYHYYPCAVRDRRTAIWHLVASTNTIAIWLQRKYYPWFWRIWSHFRIWRVWPTSPPDGPPSRRYRLSVGRYLLVSRQNLSAG